MDQPGRHRQPSHNVLRRSIRAGAGVVLAALGYTAFAPNDWPFMQGPSLQTIDDGVVSGTREPTICDGKITAVSPASRPNTNNLFSVTGMTGGNCAAVYNPQTLAPLGSLGLGAEVTACVAVNTANDPNEHLNITLSGSGFTMQGAVDVDPTQSIQEAGVQSCADLGIPDQGRVQHSPEPPAPTAVDANFLPNPQG